jgi:hypothetical protein
MDWIDMTQDRDHWQVPVNTVPNLPVLSCAVKFLSSCTTDGLEKAPNPCSQVTRSLIKKSPESLKMLVFFSYLPKSYFKQNIMPLLIFTISAPMRYVSTGVRRWSWRSYIPAIFDNTIIRMEMFTNLVHSYYTKTVFNIHLCWKHYVTNLCRTSLEQTNKELLLAECHYPFHLSFVARRWRLWPYDKVLTTVNCVLLCTKETLTYFLTNMDMLM